jgi:hypothetical protein
MERSNLESERPDILELKRIWDLAQDIQEPKLRTATSIEVLAAFVDVGRVDHALELVKAFTPEEQQIVATAQIAKSLARNGDVGQARLLVQRISQEPIIEYVLAEIAITEARKSNLTDALEIAERLRKMDLIVRVFSEIAADHQSRGDNRAADSVLSHAIARCAGQVIRLYGKELTEIYVREQFGLAHIRRGQAASGMALFYRADQEYESVKRSLADFKVLWAGFKFLRFGMSEEDLLDRVQIKAERAMAWIHAADSAAAAAEFAEMQRLSSNISDARIRIQAFEELVAVAAKTELRQEGLRILGQILVDVLQLASIGYFQEAFNVCADLAHLYPNHAGTISRTVWNADSM